jgi:hypothetical protein
MLFMITHASGKLYSNRTFVHNARYSIKKRRLVNLPLGEAELERMGEVNVHEQMHAPISSTAMLEFAPIAFLKR